MAKKQREKWHLFRNGNVEYGTGAHGTGRPMYLWSPGYSQITVNGVSGPTRRRDWYAMARRDGAQCVFHETEKAAREALHEEILPS